MYMQKTRITDRNGCCSDDMIQLGPLRSQSLFQFVQISDECFKHLLSQYFPHYVIKWSQIWRISEAAVKVKWIMEFLSPTAQW